MIGIDKDTLQLIQETAQKAVGATDKVRFIDLPEEPPGTYATVNQNGEVKKTRADPAPRTIRLHSIDEVEGFCDYIKTGLGQENLAIYVSESVVVVLFDDSMESWRMDQARVNLTESPEFVILRDLMAEGRTFTQAQFLRLLRIDLSACATPDISQLITACKAVDFSHASKRTGESDRGRESLGLDITNEVISKAGQIPERVELSVRIHTDKALAFPKDIQCHVEVDAKTGLFELIPDPGSMQAAIDAEMADIMNKMRDCGHPVFYGSV